MPVNLLFNGWKTTTPTSWWIEEKNLSGGLVMTHVGYPPGGGGSMNGYGGLMGPLSPDKTRLYYTWNRGTSTSDYAYSEVGYFNTTTWAKTILQSGTGIKIIRALSLDGLRLIISNTPYVWQNYTGSAFGTQQIIAINTSNGATVWTRAHIPAINRTISPVTEAGAYWADGTRLYWIGRMKNAPSTYRILNIDFQGETAPSLGPVVTFPSEPAHVGPAVDAFIGFNNACVRLANGDVYILQQGTQTNSGGVWTIPMWMIYLPQGTVFGGIQELPALKLMEPEGMGVSPDGTTLYARVRSYDPNTWDTPGYNPVTDPKNGIYKIPIISAGAVGMPTKLFQLASFGESLSMLQGPVAIESTAGSNAAPPPTTVTPPSSTPLPIGSPPPVVRTNTQIRHTSGTGTVRITDTDPALVPPVRDITLVPFSSPTELFETDFVQLSGNAGAIIYWANGSTTELSQQSKVELVKVRLPFDIIVRQELGQTWNRIERLLDAQNRFELRLPTGTIYVRGTTFRVKITGARVDVELIEGALERLP